MENKLTKETLKMLIEEVLNEAKKKPQNPPAEQEAPVASATQSTATSINGGAPATKKIDLKSTYPIFKFDLFNNSDLKRTFLGNKYLNQQEQIYDEISKFIQSGASSPMDKITKIQEFLTNPSSITITDADEDGLQDDDTVSYAFSSILMFKMLQHITRSNESSMGFLLENWIATMIGGTAMQSSAGSEVYDIELGDSGYSLKFLLPTSQFTQSNAVAGINYKYIIALKDKPQPTTIVFYEIGVDGEYFQEPNRIDKYIKDKELKPFVTMNLQTISTSIDQNLKNTETKTAQIFKTTNVILEELKNLQILLAFWFQNFPKEANKADKTILTEVANGIVESSKNCKAKLDELSTGDFFKQQTSASFNVSAEIQNIITANKDLVFDERLPNISITQEFAENVEIEKPTDTVLEKISQSLSTIQGKTFEETVELRMKKIQEVYDKFLSQQQSSYDIAEVFNMLILTQTLFNLGALKASDTSPAGGVGFAAGSSVGGTFAGFALEGLITLLFGERKGPNNRFTSFPMAGTKEKLDVVVIERGTQKNKIHGISAKFRVRKKYTELSNFFSLNDKKEPEKINTNPNAPDVWFKEFQNNPDLYKAITKKFDSKFQFDPNPESKVYNPYPTGETLSSKNIQKWHKAINQKEEALKEFIKLVSEFGIIEDSGKSQPGFYTAAIMYDDKLLAMLKGELKKIKKKYPDDLSTQTELAWIETNKPPSPQEINNSLLYLGDDVVDPKIQEKMKEYYERNYEEGIYYTTGASLDGSGLLSLLTGEGTTGYEKAKLQIDVTNFMKFIDNLENSLNKVKQDFIKSFKTFNIFKITTGSFLQSPSAEKHAACSESYNQFKTQANSLFADPQVTNSIGSNIAIAESKKITARYLKKLIEESFKKNK